MKKKWIPWMAAAAITLTMAGGLTGCNVTPADSGGGEVKDLSVVSFYNIWPEDETTAVGAAIKAYEKETGGEVTYKQYPYEVYNNKLVQMIAGGSSPDVIVGYWGDMPKLAAIEVIQPVDPFMDITKANYQEIVNSYVWKGKHYAGNIQQVQTPLLWFNKKMLEKEGIAKNPYELWKEDQWNWDALKEIGLKMTKDTDGDKTIDQWGFASINSAVFQWSNSAPTVRVDNAGTPTIAWKEPAYIHAMQYMQDSRFKDVFYATDPTFANTGFNEGKLAMVYGTFEYLHYNANSLDPADVGCAPFPTGPDFDGYYYGVTNLFTIAKGAKNPQGAGKLFELISAKENEMFTEHPSLGNPDAEKDLTAEHWEVIEWAIQRTRVTLDEGWGDWGYKVGNLQNLVFWDNQDIVSSLDKIEPILRAQIEDTLASQVAVVGEFKAPAVNGFEDGLGYMAVEKANGKGSAITTDANEVVDGKASLKVESDEAMQLLAYSDTSKLTIPGYKNYTVKVQYKILSAEGDTADFAVSVRSNQNLDNDVDQVGWIAIKGAPGETGTAEGKLELMQSKEYVLAILSGVDCGSVAIDNIEITEIPMED